MVRLNPIGKDTKQQMARQVNGRSPTKDSVPAVPQLTDVEIAQLCDLDGDRSSAWQCRTDLDPRHEANVTGAWRDEAQHRCVGGKRRQRGRCDRPAHRRPPSPSEDRARASCAPRKSRARQWVARIMAATVAPCYRRRESAHRWRRKQRRGGQPSTSVVEYGWVTSPVKAGLRPPPPAADGLDTACHPAIVCHQAFDCKEQLR